MISRTGLFCLLLSGVIASAWAQPSRAATPTTAAPAEEARYVVPAGTRILLSLREEISTRAALPGNPVYFVTEFPVVEHGDVVIPPGVYVKGMIDTVKRPGRVKGRAEIQLHFTSLIFPNGSEVQIPGSLSKVPGSTKSEVKDREGTVVQDSGVMHDTAVTADTTMAGTGVGSLVGSADSHYGEGAAIGAGAGATVGVLHTLLTRGQDIVIPQGSTMEMVLQRPLTLLQTQTASVTAPTGMTLVRAVPDKAAQPPVLPKAAAQQH